MHGIGVALLLACQRARYHRLIIFCARAHNSSATFGMDTAGPFHSAARSTPAGVLPVRRAFESEYELTGVVLGACFRRRLLLRFLSLPFYERRDELS